jgi:hypothetical protein
MAFVLKKTASYKWPIKVEIPVDGGKFETQTFDAVFKKMSRSAFNKTVDEGDDALIDAILQGWDGIKDEDGKDIPFTESALTQLLEIPTVAGQIVRAWFESLEVAKRKN